jgi:endonuclease G
MRRYSCAWFVLPGLLFGQPFSLAELAPWGAPQGRRDDGKLLTKSAYACFHSQYLKVSRWVVYRAEGEDSSGKRYGGGFFADPELAPEERAELSDYKGIYARDLSGYDRGHQAPDATIRKFGPEAQRETYSLANVTPQHSQVNQGIWQDIEAAVRHWSSPASPVWVATGPVFLADQETTWVGQNPVAVPHAYYLVAARGAKPELLSFLVPNAEEAPWRTSLVPFLVSVDSVESLTGLDLLPDIPDDEARRLESRRSKTLWR